MKKQIRKKSPSQTGAKKIRYAVAGLGYISQIAVLPAFKHAGSNSELCALISSDEKKLKTLGKKYKVPHLFRAEDFAECMHSGLFDAVYIALPNHAHHEYTMIAAEAGVHVLCEKPLAITEKECREMIRACRDADVKLMTAYRLHFNKANQEAAKLIHSGQLGEPRMLSSVFSMNVKDRNNIRLQFEKGGGPLFDLGIYCINAARYLFRSEPIEVTGLFSEGQDARFSEVEEAVTAIMRFPGDRLAQFTCSFGAADMSVCDVVGTKGSLRLEPAFDYAVPLKAEWKIGEKTKRKTFPKSDQFAPELIYFSECIQKNRDPEPSGEEGLIDIRIIQAIYRSLNDRRNLRLAPVTKQARPSLELVKQVPPVEAPKLVRAASPSN